MSVLSNREVDHYVDQELRTFPLLGDVHVSKGCFVGLSKTGFARVLVAGDAFCGIAYEEADNTGGASGDVSVRVYTSGDFGLEVSGLSANDIGRPVFAAGGQNLVISGRGNSYVGKVQGQVSDEKAVIRIDPFGSLVKSITHTIEDLGVGEDLPARIGHVFAQGGWVVGLRLVNQNAPAVGVDNANPSVVTVRIGSVATGSAVFNASNEFPAPNNSYVFDMPGVCAFGPEDALTVEVANSATGNLGQFLAILDYV